MFVFHASAYQKFCFNWYLIKEYLQGIYNAKISPAAFGIDEFVLDVDSKILI
jgi:hypothetical protein